MPVSQFCWEEGKTWENGYYLLSAVAEAISSIIANLELANKIHLQMWKVFEIWFKTTLAIWISFYVYKDKQTENIFISNGKI